MHNWRTTVRPLLMFRVLFLALAWGAGCVMSLMSQSGVLAGEPEVANVVLAVHGGTGKPKKDVTPEMDKKYRAALAEALKAGFDALSKPKGSGLDGVETAIRSLEDSPLFNAGKGAVFTFEGRNELDASIMEGKTKRAGAVAGVTVLKNPITAARAVMEKSKHVMMVGRGAEVFATRQGLDVVDPAYFWTEERWKTLQEVWKEAEEAARKQKADDKRSKKGGKRATAVAEFEVRPKPHEWGTVGAVARDKAGNLAAGTSTGGMTGKMFGRVGDSPIVGAGTYADNAAAAVSCTGHGEFFIRFGVAHEIIALMKYKGLSASAAAEEVIQKQLKPIDGEGACIVLDKNGKYSYSYFSDGLYRGYVTADGKVHTALYEE